MYKLFIYVVVPLVLIIYGLVMVLFFNPLVSFSTLIYPSSTSDIIYSSGKELLSKQKVSGEFYSYNNYLGTLRFFINTYYRNNTDTIIFRLKEADSSSWYIQNKYVVDRFTTGRDYPFGFPPIQNSKGKKYVFQIESLYGKKGNAVSINTSSPYLLTEYIFPKSYYRASIVSFINFMFQKVIGVFHYIYFSPLILVYFFPLILYITSIFSLEYLHKTQLYRKFLQKNLKVKRIGIHKTEILTYLFILFVLISTLIDGNNTFPLIELYLCWIFLLLLYRIGSVVSYRISLFLIILSFILLLTGNITFSEKVVVICYNLLLIALAQDMVKITLKKYNRK